MHTLRAGGAGWRGRRWQEAAPSLKVTVRAAPVNDDAEIEALMVGLAREERGGLLVLPNLFTTVCPGGLLALMGSANRVLIIRTGSMSR
jgi:hypothetical protein